MVGTANPYEGRSVRRRQEQSNRLESDLLNPSPFLRLFVLGPVQSRACGKAGKWEHSLALMDEMRSLGIEPGEGCNVMALKACAQAGLWEKTLEMLKDMRASGVNRSERCAYVFCMSTYRTDQLTGGVRVDQLLCVGGGSVRRMYGAKLAE